MAKKQQIILTHGSGVPAASAMTLGEVLVQHATIAEDAALHTVLNDGKTPVSFPSKAYVDNKISSINIDNVNSTLESLQTQINNEVSARETADNEINQIIEDNERVVSEALNDLNSRILKINGDLSNLEAKDIIIEGNIDAIQKTIDELDDIYVTDTELSNKVTELEGKITAAQTAATTKIVEGTDAGDNLSISSIVDDKGVLTYTIDLNNVASASALDNVSNRLTSAETAINTTLPNSISTAKTDAIASANTYTDNAKTAIESVIGGSYTSANTVHNAISGIQNDLKNYATDTELSTAISTLEGKINAAQTAATTKIVEGTDAGNNLSVTETTGETGTTYTIALNDVASASALTSTNTKINVLIGEDINKSVRTIANEELAAQLLGENNAEDNFKTLQELAAWLEQHPEDAAAMNTAISNNTKSIADEVSRATGVEEGLNNRLTSAETAINTTLPNSINTAKTDAIASANTYTDNAKTAIESVIGGSYTSANTVHNAISANTNAISGIQNDLKNYVTDTELSDKVAELEGKINAAQTAATTKIVEGTDAGDNLSISSIVDDKGVLTYTIDLNNVASASDLKNISDKVDIINGNGDGSIVKTLTDAKTYTDNKLKELNATVSGTSDHITVKVIETEGKLTNVTVSENDIASASGLTSVSDRVSTIENSYVNSVTVTNSSTNKITASINTNTLTLNFDNMIIDGGTY